MASYYTLDYNHENTFKKLNGLYFNQSTTYLEFRDERKQKYRIELYKDFITDGGSIPCMFRWFMPSWDDNNVLLNLAYACHDYLYGSEAMAKALADDLLRGILRDADYNRVHASTVCWAVNNFANRHYGRKYDKFDCANYGKLIVL